MTLETITQVASAVGALIAAIALVLNLLQFRRLERSIQGNTYQQLAQYALKMKEILLEHPEIEYLYTQGTGERRSQEIFDRLVGNYLEDMWFQKKYGLIDKEMWKAYEALVKGLVVSNPNLIKHMLQPNFAETLRAYIRKISEETVTSSSAVSASRDSDKK